jgi:ParB family chromosome partitioning protein
MSALWQFDRLSAASRDAAELAAQRAGQPLSLWLGRLIAETSAAEGIAFEPEAAPAAAPAYFPPPRPVMPPIQPQRATVEPFPSRPAALPPRPVAAPLPVAPAMTRPATTAPMPAPQAAPMGIEATTLMLPPSVLDVGTVGTRQPEHDAPEALIAAIARDGMRQPILARRKAGEDGRYEIIAGRRRWRAAKRLGMTQIAAVVTNLSDSEAVLASLGENLGEDNLSPIEEARAYLRLMTEFSFDPREIAATVDRAMPHIVRSLRLLGLPPKLRDLIASGRLNRDQAYALLDASDPERAAEHMLSEQSHVDEALRRIAALPAMERR